MAYECFYRIVLIFYCFLSILLCGLTRFSGLILCISCLNPRISLFLIHQTGLFSGKLNFRIKVWVSGMFIYLVLVIVSRHFNKVTYLGRGEKHTKIYVFEYVHMQRSYTSWVYVDIFKSVLVLKSFYLTSSQGHGG